MPILQREQPEPTQLHPARQMTEPFGPELQRYDDDRRTRRLSRTQSF